MRLREDGGKGGGAGEKCVRVNNVKGGRERGRRKTMQAPNYVDFYRARIGHRKEERSSGHHSASLWHTRVVAAVRSSFCTRAFDINSLIYKSPHIFPKTCLHRKYA